MSVLKVRSNSNDTWKEIITIKGDPGAKGDKGDKGDSVKGDKGDPGYTPVKGTDYFTEADKTELVNAVLAALPSTEEVAY